VPGYANPQSLNRFSYVLNNPLRYTDPTGHMACGDGEAHDCNGHRQDPNQNPHPPKPPQPPKLPKEEDKSKDDDYPQDPKVSLDPNPVEDGDNEYFCLTHLSSCDININPNAIVDPLAWTHIAEGILGGVVLFGVGDLLIGAGAYVCTTVIGCIAGAPVVLAGVAAYPVGVGFIYFGVKSTEIYVDDIFEVTPSKRRR